MQLQFFILEQNLTCFQLSMIFDILQFCEYVYFFKTTILEERNIKVGVKAIMYDMFLFFLELKTFQSDKNRFFQH